MSSFSPLLSFYNSTALVAENFNSSRKMGGKIISNAFLQSSVHSFHIRMFNDSSKDQKQNNLFLVNIPYNGKVLRVKTGGDVEHVPQPTHQVDKLVDEVGDELKASIELDEMQKANEVIEDFCLSYFMFHGMDPNNPEEIFKFLPVISFTESYIYKLDRSNERVLSKPHEIHQEKNADSATARKSGLFRPLFSSLEKNGLLTERIKAELECGGEEYWLLERKICCQMNDRLSEISFEDVKRAMYLRSTDYRVLNLLLYQSTGKEVNELHMEFLSASTLLVEIMDDILDYEDDVMENTFNILRIFVRLYGVSKAPSMLAKYIAEAEEKYDTLFDAFDDKLRNCFQKRRKEILLLFGLDPNLSTYRHETCELGGEKTVYYTLGSWTIPPLIADEEIYRASRSIG